MATTKDRALSRQLHALFNLGALRELTDGQLLERFARGDREAGELAFASLIERHGAMVMRVCRAHLRDPQDRQDAFQATFLVLVEKARGLWVRDSLGPWLHQVALRTASCARAAALRRQRLEQRAAEITASRDARENTGDPELARVLHEEIARLPERYRVPIVLCDLEGRTCEEAARVMGRPVGTIKSWRSRGRERLRDRLIRAGLAPAVAAALTADTARAAVAAPAADPVVRAAVWIVSKGMGAGVVPAPVSTLVKGVMRSMFLNQLRTVMAALCVLTLVGSGLLGVARVAAEDPPPVAPPRAELPHVSSLEPPKTMMKPTELGGEAWPMSLGDAIRIGLENSEVIRVVTLGTFGKPVGGFEPAPSEAAQDPARTNAGASPIVIRRLKHDAPRTRVKAEVMAGVRSIEQQYWNLNAAYLRLWAAREAVALAEAAVKQEPKGRTGGRGESTEVRLRLEQLRLDLVTRISEATTVERQLRNLLGLAPADHRRIVPITPPAEGRLEPDWNTSLATMLEAQPDVLEARESAHQADGGSSALMPVPTEGPAERTKWIDRQNAFLRQVIHQTTHSLARFFLELDANYKQFKTASHVRTAAVERLDAQRVEYEAGRIPAERFFDALAQFTAAVASEAQFKATYNISIIALEEAKGTLLEYDKIVLTDGPAEKNGSPGARSDGGVKRASHQAEKSEPAPAGKTYSFHLTIGSGPRPFAIRGSFNVAPSGEEDVAKAGGAEREHRKQSVPVESARDRAGAER